MRPVAKDKVSAYREREERLRRGRDAAQPLRVAFPSAATVEVQLQFLPASTPPHAAQSFRLYPAARAFFWYPCPYGDCDGIYDLAASAQQALTSKSRGVTGTLECTGVRSRDGQQRRACGLQVSYRILAQHEPAPSARRTAPEAPA
jgi:hypothetical protein